MLKQVKKLAKFFLEKPGKTSGSGAKIGSVAVSKVLEAALSTFQDVISFYHTGRGFYLAKNKYIQIRL